MDVNQIENTLKKMGMVLEKLVQKVDEIDKRVAKLEEAKEKKFSSQDLKAQPQPEPKQSTSQSSGGFGSSFLGSLAGAFAGIGLFNLLFNNSVTPNEFGKDIGMSEDEISKLEDNFNEIDSKLEEIDSKLEELDSKLTDEDVMNTDYFESYEEDDTNDDMFGGGFDDLSGFDEV